jgi:hypothetical protein
VPGALKSKKLRRRCRNRCIQFVLRPETIRDIPMAKLIFINLPVSDLARATAF